MAVGKYKVPFRNGNLEHYARNDSAYYSDRVEWRENTPFYATIEFTGMRSGYSAKYLIVSDGMGNTYPMFVTDTLSVLQYGHVSDGKCEGLWCVQKRGQNYGLRLVKPDERKNSSQS